jgi:hypothetical protein
MRTVGYLSGNSPHPLVLSVPTIVGLQVERGEFPTPEQLFDYEAFVITGSKYDAHGSEVWIRMSSSIMSSNPTCVWSYG